MAGSRHGTIENTTCNMEHCRFQLQLLQKILTRDPNVMIYLREKFSLASIL